MSLRSQLGAALEDIIQPLSPARRLRFQLTTEALEHSCGGRRLSVLDAGCGDGLLSERLAKRHPDWRIVGVDLRQELLEQARARTAGRGLANVEFVHGDLTGDLGDGLYDAVLAIECLEEIVDDERALAMMARALRPGGLFIAHVPEREWTPVLRGSDWTWRDQVRQGYVAREFADQLARAGFAVMEIGGTCHSIVRLGHELRDRVKNAPVWLRALFFPLMLVAVALERHGVTLGRERALLAVARRADEAAGVRAGELSWTVTKWSRHSGSL